MDHTHDHTVDHIDRFTFVFFTLDSFLLIFHTVLLVYPLLLVVLTFDIFLENTFLDACAALVELLGILCTRLKVHIVQLIILTLVIVILRVHDVTSAEILLIVLLRLVLSIVIHDSTIQQISLFWLSAQGMVCLGAFVMQENRIANRALPTF